MELIFVQARPTLLPASEVQDWLEYQATYMASTSLCISLSLIRGYNTYKWLLSRQDVLPCRALAGLRSA